MWKILSQSNRAAKGFFLGGTAAALAAGFLSAATAYFLGMLLGDTGQILLYVACFGGAILLRMAITYGQQVAFTHLASSIQADLRRQVGHSVAHMHMRGIDKLRTGDMLTRANADMNGIFTFYQRRLPGTFSEATAAAFSLALLLWVRWEIAVFVVVGLTLLAALNLYLSNKYMPAHKAWMRSASELNVLGNDLVFGQADIKAMGMREPILDKHMGALSLWIKAFSRRTNLRAAQRGTNALYGIVVFLCIPLLGAYFMAQGAMGIGTVLMAMQAAGILADALTGINHRVTDINEFHVSRERVLELIRETPQRQDGEDLAIDENAPLVEFSDVSFAYEQEDILRGVSLQVMPGQHVALVGASGSGKTTVLRLMAGLYEASGGSARFAGHDMSKWSLSAMRRHMAYVQQDTFLFQGSLRENIACGDAIANLDEVLERAQLKEWLSRQPQGLEADVGERGGKLSGGLRQRVSIARAMARRPILYLFDEPTSALDTAMEAEIVAAMGRASEGAASVTVAHRLSSIVGADVIYAMREGQVVESGTHEELMAARGYYYDLYTQQDREAKQVG